MAAMTDASSAVVFLHREPERNSLAGYIMVHIPLPCTKDGCTCAR